MNYEQLKTTLLIFHFFKIISDRIVALLNSVETFSTLLLNTFVLFSFFNIRVKEIQKHYNYYCNDWWICFVANCLCWGGVGLLLIHLSCGIKNMGMTILFYQKKWETICFIIKSTWVWLFETKNNSQCSLLHYEDGEGFNALRSPSRK